MSYYHNNEVCGKLRKSKKKFLIEWWDGGVNREMVCHGRLGVNFENIIWLLFDLRQARLSFLFYFHTNLTPPQTFAL